MFSSINRLIGNITVKEERDVITIEGLNAKGVTTEIAKEWSTSKIESYMFLKVRANSLSFYSFFAGDFVYIVEKLRSERRRFVNVRVLDKILMKMREDTWLRQTVTTPQPWLNYKRLNDLAYPPLPEQEEFFKVFERNTQLYELDGYVLGAAPGTGKTFASLALAYLTECDVNICVVPKNTVREVWLPHLESMFKKHRTYWASDSGIWPPPKGLQHYIVHYEALEAFVGWAKQQRWKLPFITLDESHRFNEWEAARTQFFIQLAGLFLKKYVLWSSGTPFKALGAEAIPMMTTIDRKFNAYVRERFKGIFGKNAKRALDILANRIGLMTYKVDKRSAVKGEPELYREDIKLANGEVYTLEAIRTEMRNFITERMKHYKEFADQYRQDYDRGLNYYESVRLRTPKDEKEYRQYLDWFKMICKRYDPVLMKEEVKWVNQYEKNQIIPKLPKELKEPFKQSRSVVKYVELKVQGEALGRILGRTRTACHVDMVEGANLQHWIDTSESKTVIFTSYVEVAKRVTEYLERQGYQPTLVFADTNNQLNQIRKAFAEDEDVNPLVATFQSLSTGVPLVMASTLIMLNSPFRDYERDQTVSRVDRLGQTKQVRIVEAFLDTGGAPNISTRSKDILEWSREQVEIIMGTNVSDYGAAMESFSDDFDFPLPELEVAMESAIESIHTPRPMWTAW